MTEQKPTAEANRIATEIERECKRRWSHPGVPFDGLKEAIATLIMAKEAELKSKLAAWDKQEHIYRNALKDYEAQVLKLEGYLERANWRRCDIAACNCNGYHNWNPSRAEIEEPLHEQITAKDAEIERLKSAYQSKLEACCATVRESGHGSHGLEDHEIGPAIANLKRNRDNLREQNQQLTESLDRMKWAAKVADNEKEARRQAEAALVVAHKKIEQLETYARLLSSTTTRAEQAEHERDEALEGLKPFSAVCDEVKTTDDNPFYLHNSFEELGRLDTLNYGHCRRAYEIIAKQEKRNPYQSP